MLIENNTEQDLIYLRDLEINEENYEDKRSD